MRECKLCKQTFINKSQWQLYCNNCQKMDKNERRILEVKMLTMVQKEYNKKIEKQSVNKSVETENSLKVSTNSNANIVRELVKLGKNIDEIFNETQIKKSYINSVIKFDENRNK